MRSSLARKSALSFVLSVAMLTPVLGAAELEPCHQEPFGPEARCGQIEVFEDRVAKSGRTLGLNIVVLPATGPNVREPLFLLAGGPGQGGTDLAELALGPFASVREHRDVVLVDQRGTGSSGRIDCPVDPDQTPQEVFDNLFDPKQLHRCLQEIKKAADPTLYTTAFVVDDLDEVRSRLGYEKVMLWGGSGGTRTALVWMRRHPERVVGAVLDGVVPTDFRAPSTMARGCQDTLEAVFEECRQQDSCHAAFPELQADFHQLLSLFDAGPVATHILDPQGTKVQIELDRGAFSYAVRSISYRSRSLAKLPAMIHQAAGSGDLHPFAQAYWQRQVGVRPYVAMGVHFGVYCSEDLPFIADSEVAGFTDGTFVGRYLYDQYRGACDAWESDPLEESFLLPVESESPVLIISGYYDPSTPIRMGEQVAAHLPNSRHVKVRNESHGAEFGCARPATVQFLTHGNLEELGPICEDAGPIQYEVSP